MIIGKKVAYYGYPMTTRLLCANIAFLVCLLITNNAPVHKHVAVFQLFEVTYWANFIYCILLMLFLIFIVSVQYSMSKYFDFEFIILIFFSLYGLILLCYSADFLSFFLALEIYSLPTYVLITAQMSPKSTEAGLKYFILGCTFSALFLFSISLVYYQTGTTNFRYLEQLLFATDFEFRAVIFSVVIIVVVFAFKVSAVPFHMGVLDAYEGAPLVVTTYLNVFPKIPLFLGFYNILNKCFSDYAYIYASLLLIIGVLSIV